MHRASAEAAPTEPLDGGYEYVVMVSSFLGQFFMGTTLVGFGTMTAVFPDVFETSPGELATIGVLSSGFMNFSGSDHIIINTVPVGSV